MAYIPTVYPTALDSAIANQSVGTVLIVGGSSSPGHSYAHLQISQALLALQKIVGCLNSQDPDSLVYKVNQLNQAIIGNSGTVSGTESITGGYNDPFSLVNDVPTPQEGQFYGYTNGVRGWSTVPFYSLANTPSLFPPLPHHTTHQDGGTDQLPVDTLNHATDNVNLNASQWAHGLLPKLANTGTEYLRDDGTWKTVSGGGGGGDITDAISAAAGSEVSVIFDGSGGSLTDAVSDAAGSEVSLIAP